LVRRVGKKTYDCSIPWELKRSMMTVSILFESKLPVVGKAAMKCWDGFRETGVHQI